jgi:tetratricopeptide (TPR) repeat protein
VIVLLDKLIKKILTDQHQRQHNKVDEVFSINIFTTNGTGDGQSTSGINGHFIHSQLLIDCILRMKSNSTDRSELISICKQQYEGNDVELKILKDFERNYSPSQALYWYTRQSFLYRLLNKALRIQNVDLIFLFRFFIHDIEQQLDNNKCTSPVHVYRGQLMAKTEVGVLKNSVGEFISLSSFLSTSLNREVALSFLVNSNTSDDLERVFFEINADSRLKDAKPFSNITSHSYFRKEEEILFMIGSIFQLVRIDHDHDGIWIIQMKLCSSNDHQLKSLFEHMKSEYNDGDNTLLLFSDVLFKMGKFDDAEKYYRRLLKELPSNHKYLARCYQSLGIVAMEKDDLESSLVWLNKSLKIKLQTLKSNDPAIADSYNSIGRIHRKRDELDSAIKMFEKALIIWKKALGDDAIEVATCYSDIGNAYQRKKDFSQALDYHLRSLTINEKQLPKYHRYLGSAHTNIASTYRCLENYDLSLEHAHLALEIFEKSLPGQHSQIGWALENIGLAHEKQGDLEQSLSYLKKALDIYRGTLPITHYYIVDIERNIQHVSSQLK